MAFFVFRYKRIKQVQEMFARFPLKLDVDIFAHTWKCACTYAAAISTLAPSNISSGDLLLLVVHFVSIAGSQVDCHARGKKKGLRHFSVG